MNEQKCQSPFSALHELLDSLDSESLCLLTIVTSVGSVPQHPGACAIIGKDGLLWGTIGGGKLEADMIIQAQEAKAPFLKEINMAEDYSREAGPICGGRVTVFGNPLLEEAKSTIATIAKATADKVQGIAEIHIGGNSCGTINWQPSPDIWNEQPSVSGNMFLLPIFPPPPLLIIGAGHCGRALAELAQWAGFDVTVADDRPELLDPERFSSAVSLLEVEPQKIADNYTICRRTSIALVSPGHRGDAEALESCIHSDAAYIGMIGSRRKVQLLKSHFLDEGLATAEEWGKLHTPIGLDIGANTVNEIAVSIMGQIIKEKKSGGF